MLLTILIICAIVSLIISLIVTGGDSDFFGTLVFSGFIFLHLAAFVIGIAIFIALISLLLW